MLKKCVWYFNCYTYLHSQKDEGWDQCSFPFEWNEDMKGFYTKGGG